MAMPVGIESEVLCPGVIPTMSARLILAVGSRAGLEASLHVGYYMIGRHDECQIRPKSRSVSRRHCLLHHHEDGLKVLDLESSAGTYVDHVRLEPKRWYPLKDGSELRCGKVLFKAGISDEVETTTPAKDWMETAASGASIVRGDAWHDVDVAGFLDTEDSADRERRYADIRSAQDSDELDDDVSFTVTDDMDGLEDAFGDDFFHTAEALPSDSAVSGVAASQKSGKKASANLVRSRSHKETAKTKKTKPTTKPPSTPNAKRNKLDRSGPRLSVGGVEQWKLVGAVVLTIAMVGFFGFKAYKLYAGPEVRVLRGID